MLDYPVDDVLYDYVFRSIDGKASQTRLYLGSNGTNRGHSFTAKETEIEDKRGWSKV